MNSDSCQYEVKHHVDKKEPVRHKLSECAFNSKSSL